MTDLDQALLDRSKERKAFAALFLACAVLTGSGLAFAAIAGGPAKPPTVQLGDVAEAHVVEIRDHRGITVVSGEFRSRVDALGNTEKDAALMDRRGRRVVGEVEIELPADGREDRRPELEVDIMELEPRQSFTVVVDDRPVATFTTDDRGSVDMELQEGEVTPPVS